jgi:hypothetical protein
MGTIPFESFGVGIELTGLTIFQIYFINASPRSSD